MSLVESITFTLLSGERGDQLGHLAVKLRRSPEDGLILTGFPIFAPAGGVLRVGATKT